jgi:uncharacterized membrane protein YqaE (UPF0057 family)
VKPEVVKSSMVKAGRQVKSKSAIESKIVSSIKANASKMLQKAPIKIAGTNGINQTNDSDVNLILLVILAILLPPLAVYLYFGEINIHFWINLILCLVGGGVGAVIGYWGLAVIHALLVVFGIFG